MEIVRLEETAPKWQRAWELYTEAADEMREDGISLLLAAAGTIFLRSVCWIGKERLLPRDVWRKSPANGS